MTADITATNVEMAKDPLDIFISYSHRDCAMLERFLTHLAMLKREKLINLWCDQELEAGQCLDREIQSKLQSCKLFIPLVSPDFLKSSYCYDIETAAAISRCTADNLRILPIIIEPCDWQSSVFKQFNVLPADGKPISEWPNPNTGFLDVVVKLRRILRNMRGTAVNAFPRVIAKTHQPTNRTHEGYSIGTTDILKKSRTYGVTTLSAA